MVPPPQGGGVEGGGGFVPPMGEQSINNLVEGKTLNIIALLASLGVPSGSRTVAKQFETSIHRTSRTDACVRHDAW